MVDELERLASFTVETFSPLVGNTFWVLSTDSETVTHLELTEAAVSPHGRPHVRPPFSLIFTGPANVPLPQDTYLLRHEILGDIPLFIVPIRADAELRSYQAIFN